MKKIVKIALGIVALFLVVLWYSHIEKANAIYDSQLDIKQYLETGEMFGKTVDQEFVSRENIIHGVSIKCKQIGAMQDISEAIIVCSVLEIGTLEIVAQGSTNIAELQNSKFNKIEFDEPITQSKGKQYLLQIETKDDNAESTIALFTQPDAQETLIVRIITKRFDLETCIVLVLFIAFILGFMRVLVKLFSK